MEEQLVTFETAKIVKEKGFVWYCNAWFYISNIDEVNAYPKYYREKALAEYTEIGGKLVATVIGGQPGKTINTKFKNSDMSPNIIAAPTQSFLQKWLREVHNLYVESNPNASGYGWFIDKTNGTYIDNSAFTGPNGGGRWDIYEEALEVGLQKALSLI